MVKKENRSFINQVPVTHYSRTPLRTAPYPCAPTRSPTCVSTAGLGPGHVPGIGLAERASWRSMMIWDRLLPAPPLFKSWRSRAMQYIRGTLILTEYGSDFLIFWSTACHFSRPNFCSGTRCYGSLLLSLGKSGAVKVALNFLPIQKKCDSHLFL